MASQLSLFSATQPKKNTKIKHNKNAKNKLKSKIKVNKAPKFSSKKKEKSSRKLAKPSKRASQIAKKADLELQPSTSQLKAKHIFQILKSHGLAADNGIQSANQLKKTLWNYINNPRYADDVNAYCKWYRNIKPFTYYKVPKRDTNLISDQKLAEQRPSALNLKSLRSYLGNLPDIYYPNGTSKYFL